MAMRTPILSRVGAEIQIVVAGSSRLPALNTSRKRFNTTTTAPPTTAPSPIHSHPATIKVSTKDARPSSMPRELPTKPTTTASQPIPPLPRALGVPLAPISSPKNYVFESEKIYDGERRAAERRALYVYQISILQGHGADRGV
jgi:hypothetical protein